MKNNCSKWLYNPLLTFILALFFLPESLQAQEAKRWYDATTVYQIYPLSFKDSDGDGTGDIPGIISKLDYLKTLGIETLWLSPVYSSPWQDHGYDISGYTTIHPRMGNMDDFDRLIQEARKRNMRIVMDLVMNHTSEQHPWFQAAIKDKPGGPFRNMYVWKEGKKRPNNWKSMTSGNGWHYHKEAKAWYWASFLPFQPDLNYHNPAVKDSLFGVMDFWIQRGVSGFRLDIFNCLAEDSLFRNNPPSLRPIPSEGNPDGFFQKVTYTQNTEKTLEIAREFRAHLDSVSQGEAFSVGEVFGSGELLQKYTAQGQGLHSVFFFKTMHAGFKPHKWKKIIRENDLNFPYPQQPTWVLSNHDKKRFISRLKNKESKMRCVVFMQFTLRGIPFIYQGEELGMRQQKLNPKFGQDPIVKKFGVAATRFARISGESLNRDECRTPFSWNSEKNAGFSTSDSPWLSPAKEAGNIHAEKQLNDPNSLFHFYRKLLSMRKSLSELNSGKMDSLRLKNKILSYRRYSDQSSMYCYINFARKSRRIKEKTAEGKVIFGNIETDAKGRNKIPGRSSVILWVRP
ncbi:MAG: alpha-amylase family glycosyl hydrolase [Flavobacteriales bacterium]|nr:alpha-amylase family glycosyl hydrolase [Flavobacteriales bacterium]